VHYQDLSDEISILLPFKEGFSNKNFGSVSLYVKQINENSKFLKNIKIYSHSRYQTFDKFYVEHLPKSISHLFFGKNFGHTKSFIKSLNSKKKPKIIEVHNRPKSIFQISHFLPNSKKFLFYHNDPLSFGEYSTIKSRKELINICDKICFVSKFLKERFLKELSKSHINNSKLQVIYNGVEPRKFSRLSKKQNIVFIGELSQNKGFNFFLEAVEEICNEFKDWTADIYGKSKTFNHSYIKNPKIHYHGFLSNDELIKQLEKSSICVVPSVWNEPFGRVLLESVNAGVATITSVNGGLKEIADHFKVIKIENIDKKTIYNALKKLIMSKNEIIYYSNNNVSSSPFTLKKISNKLDSLRKDSTE
tara:strand:+ start:1044 stop:2129 length:1086 start_codon:yes stop_codon:yes gene_type:complete